MRRGAKQGRADEPSPPPPQPPQRRGDQAERGTTKMTHGEQRGSGQRQMASRLMTTQPSEGVRDAERRGQQWPRWQQRQRRRRQPLSGAAAAPVAHLAWLTALSACFFAQREDRLQPMRGLQITPRVLARSSCASSFTCVKKLVAMDSAPTKVLRAQTSSTKGAPSAPSFLTKRTPCTPSHGYPGGRHGARCPERRWQRQCVRVAGAA